MKKCSRCKENKVANDFYKQKSAKDGLYPLCKRCNNGLGNFLENIDALESAISYIKEYQ